MGLDILQHGVMLRVTLTLTNTLEEITQTSKKTTLVFVTCSLEPRFLSKLCIL